ncbi:SAM-dependent methyltransferase [Polyangium sp. 6x1]|uniref:class I SAM-dependent methyltransferase n=1 Tax=Polyangium sp. 6x1 TaxID=3042689 RepID=UPI002482C54B|nr:SAM-dependent methyltransferase [Polyangium sp. 6x1]MDI1447524.1 SAM-dependent methyltransferase [Polyangium sp. 6x1]
MRLLPGYLLVPLAALVVACGSSQPPAETAKTEETPPQTTTTTPTAEKPAASGNIPAAIAAIVAAPDRAEADRALDAGRKPAELLAFLDIRPGMKVAEIAAGGGYTAELLARTVGEAGKVYGQNSKFILERFAEKPWAERLQKPVMKNVVRVDREFDEPLPPEAKELDAVVMVLFYHDTIWMKTDRDKMNKTIFQALRPGGVYGIVDHSAKAGSGTSEAQTTHRIEEKTLREEVERAGFKLAGEASFLRNEKDTRDWNASPMKAGELRGTSDRFVLKFVKP